MGAIKLDSFMGMVPFKDALALPQNAASECVDARLGTGTLRGWSAPAPVHVLSNPAAKMVFRLPGAPEVGRAPNWANSTWLEFEDIHTDVVCSPISDDRYRRIYWTSPSMDRPRYSSRDRISMDLPDYVLGVPAPADALNVVPPDFDTTSPPAVRSYLFTYVTDFGEEGPPSPPVTRTGKQTGGWQITFPPIPATDTTDRAIVKRRVYRTVTGSSGVADFFMVGEYTLDVGTATDFMDDTVVTARAVLASQMWTPPPPLLGMVSLMNGMIAGWTESNEVWFCEPYRPHAWPAKYAVTFPYPIVGLGVSGANLFVLTSAVPFVMTGPNPGAMKRDALQFAAPCLSRRSITSSQDGVHYASTEGLIATAGPLMAPSTFQFARREDWLREVNPYDFRAVRIGTTYYAVTGDGSGLLFDVTANRQMFAKISPDQGWINATMDIWSGGALLIGGGMVYAMDTTDAAPLLPYRWRSRAWHISKLDNLGAMKVFFRRRDTLPDLGAPVENPTALTDEMWGVVRLFASFDGGQTMRQVFARELRVSGELIRPPAGFKSEFWQVEIEGRVEVTGVQVASSVRELAAV